MKIQFLSSLWLGAGRMPKDDLRFDVRLVEKFLAKGILSREEYEKYLASLPDVSSQAEPVFEDTEKDEAKPKMPEKRAGGGQIGRG